MQEREWWQHHEHQCSSFNKLLIWNMNATWIQTTSHSRQACFGSFQQQCYKKRVGCDTPPPQCFVDTHRTFQTREIYLLCNSLTGMHLSVLPDETCSAAAVRAQGSCSNCDVHAVPGRYNIIYGCLNRVHLRASSNLAAQASRTLHRNRAPIRDQRIVFLMQ